MMLKLFRKTKAREVAFCDRCGSVCDATCRANAIRDRALEQALVQGGPVR
jgi:hypothetical protein